MSISLWECISLLPNVRIHPTGSEVYASKRGASATADALDVRRDVGPFGEELTCGDAF